MKHPALAAAAVVGLFSPVLLVQGQGKSSQPHGELRIDCGECHSPERWVPVVEPPLFRHDSTGFSLELSHAKASCRACHVALVFSQVGTSCVDCHKDPHRGELGARCETCHTPATWTNQREMFQVHSRTRFPLFVAHAHLDCDACHRNQRPYEYATTPADCGDCHLSTFLQTSNPPHQASGFSRRCQDCHNLTASSWAGANFSHPASFPLAAGHAGLPCARCHTGGRYAGTSSACFSCHQANYAATTSPNHQAAGFPTQCEGCHSTAAWHPASFDHSRTGFPLTGAHASTDCARCHVGGRFAGTPTDCFACHQANFNATTSPNHRSAGFPTQCQTCHSTTAWRPATFDHAQTGFPLTGAHASTDCARCHVGGRFAGTPTDCFACHQANYNATTNPNHQSAGFPTQCQTCHNTTAWQPATFDHGRTRFPLTGAHAGLACTQCHAGGRYTGTPTNCYACHQANYNATTNPNHQAAGFPTDCQTCHNTTAWQPATFNHDGSFFPIYSGRHRGQWSSCSDCHTNASNYAAFECIFCHAHSNRASVDSNHRGVSGYSYQSAACYRCHPRGVAGGSVGGVRRLGSKP